MRVFLAGLACSTPDGARELGPFGPTLAVCAAILLAARGISRAIREARPGQ